MIVRGTHVSVVTTKNRELRLRGVIADDPTGHDFRSCDAYVLRVLGAGKGERVDRETSRAAEKWFGRGTKRKIVRLAPPRGPWKKVAMVRELRYDRQGELRDAYFHPFEVDVPLWKSADGSHRLALPDGCSITERGFVKP